MVSTSKVTPAVVTPDTNQDGTVSPRTIRLLNIGLVALLVLVFGGATYREITRPSEPVQTASASGVNCPVAIKPVSAPMPTAYPALIGPSMESTTPGYLQDCARHQIAIYGQLMYVPADHTNLWVMFRTDNGYYYAVQSLPRNVTNGVEFYLTETIINVQGGSDVVLVVATDVASDQIAASPTDADATLFVDQLPKTGALTVHSATPMRVIDVTS